MEKKEFKMTKEQALNLAKELACPATLWYLMQEFDYDSEVCAAGISQIMDESESAGLIMLILKKSGYSPDLCEKVFRYLIIEEETLLIMALAEMAGSEEVYKKAEKVMSEWNSGDREHWKDERRRGKKEEKEGGKKR